MRAADRHGRTPRRWKKTTVADPDATTRPDLIGRDFGIDPDQPGQLDRRWCGDITYSAQFAVMCSAVGGPRWAW
jgi:hypothetical protein